MTWRTKAHPDQSVDLWLKAPAVRLSGRVEGHAPRGVRLSVVGPSGAVVGWLEVDSNDNRPDDGKSGCGCSKHPDMTESPVE